MRSRGIDALILPACYKMSNKFPAARYQPKPPRLICFFGRTEGGRQASYQLTIHRNGKKAHIDGPDVSADFTNHQLTRFLADVVTKWTDAHRSLVPPEPSGWNVSGS
jgi:hypothetical protein